MKQQWAVIGGVAGFVLVGVVVFFASGLGGRDAARLTPADRVTMSQEIAGQFVTHLMNELAIAIRDHGPAGAIAVCKDISPAAEAHYAGKYPELAGVRRISQRTRNPLTHTPAPAEAAALAQIETQLAQGQPAAPQVIAADAGRETVLIPIVIRNPQCLTCHGDPEQMEPALRAALQENYPEDRATGYKQGDLRGAFAFVWKTEKE